MKTHLLDDVAVGRPFTRANVTIIPLYLVQAPGFPVAADLTDLQIAEVSDAEVESAEVLNPTSQAVLIPQGYLLVGGRQHRVVLESVLVDAGARVEIRTACVQRGRWSGGDDFLSSGLFAPPSVRRVSLTPFSNIDIERLFGRERLSPIFGRPNFPPRRRSRGCCDVGPETPWADWPLTTDWADSLDDVQNAVWGQVASSLTEVGRESETTDLLEAFEEASHSADYRHVVDEIVSAGPKAGQNGLLVSHGSQIVGFELFSSPDLLAMHWGGLVRSIFLSRPEKVDGFVSAGKALRFIGGLSSKVGREDQSEGLGITTQISSKNFSGRALVHDEAVIHAVVLRKPTSRSY